ERREPAGGLGCARPPDTARVARHEDVGNGASAPLVENGTPAALSRVPYVVRTDLPGDLDVRHDALVQQHDVGIDGTAVPYDPLRPVQPFDPQPADARVNGHPGRPQPLPQRPAPGD